MQKLHSADLFAAVGLYSLVRFYRVLPVMQVVNVLWHGMQWAGITVHAVNGASTQASSQNHWGCLLTSLDIVSEGTEGTGCS